MPKLLARLRGEIQYAEGALADAVASKGNVRLASDKLAKAKKALAEASEVPHPNGGYAYMGCKCEGCR
jgi:hypothetical protein